MCHVPCFAQWRRRFTTRGDAETRRDPAASYGAKLDRNNTFILFYFISSGPRAASHLLPLLHRPYYVPRQERTPVGGNVDEIHGLNAPVRPCRLPTIHTSPDVFCKLNLNYHFLLLLYSTRCTTVVVQHLKFRALDDSPITRRLFDRLTPRFATIYLQRPNLARPSANAHRVRPAVAFPATRIITKTQ